MSQAQISPTTMLIRPENAATIGLEYKVTLLSFTKKGNVHFTALDYDDETNTHTTRSVGTSNKVKLGVDHSMSINEFKIEDETESDEEPVEGDNPE